MLWDGRAPVLAVVVGAVLWLWTAALIVVSGWLLCRSRSCIRRQLCGRRKEIDPDTAWAWLSPFGITGSSHGSDALAVHAQVEAIADSQRLERVRSVLKLGAFAIPVVILRNIATAHELTENRDHRYLLCSSGILFEVLFEFVALIFFFRPAALSKRALQVGYAILMARDVYVATVEAQVPDGSVARVVRGEYMMVFIQLVRLWIGLLLQNIQCTVALHLLVVPATILVRALFHEDEDTLQRAVAEILFGVLVCLACAMVESANRATIIANLRAQSAKALEGAAASMLAGICDAVVHLSGSLHIKEPCQRLSILLLKDPTVQWQGKYFGDLFMSGDDVATFKSFIEKAPSNGDSLACTMHATLRDAHGAPVLVQFFHATCHGLDGSEVHLVGIRDAGGERIGPAPATNATSSDLMPQRCDQQMQDALGALRAVSESSWTSASTQASAIPLEMSDQSSVKIWVSVKDSSLPILRYTHAFVSMFGASAARLGADLLDLTASRKEQESLLKQMHVLTNQLLHDDNGDEISRNLQMDLSTRRLGAIRIETSVTLHMECDSEEGLEAPVENAETDLDLNVLIHFNSYRVLGSKNCHCSRSTMIAKKPAGPLPLGPLAVNPEAAGSESKKLLAL